MGVEVCVLGPLQVCAKGRAIELSGRVLPRVLLALTAHAPDAVSVDQLVESVWGDAAPSSVVPALRVHVGRLRELLEPDAISTTAGGYRLTNPDNLDAYRYEQLSDRARRVAAVDAEGALRDLDSALSLWRGRPWVDVADEAWVTAAVAALEQRHRDDVERRSDLRLDARLHAEYIDDFRRAVVDEPLSERRWAQLIRALYRSGRDAEALRAFEEASEVIAVEVGTRPGPLVQAAYDEAIAGGDIAVYSRHASQLEPLVGRQIELRDLEALVDQHHLVSVLGIGGIGKTRLAEELVANVRKQGRLTCILTVPASDLEHRVVRELVAPTGVPAPTEDDALDALSAQLRGIDLVVLDGAESCLAAMRTLVLRLVHRHPRMHIVVTTRQPLDLGNEVHMTVGPLPTPGPDAPWAGSAAELLAYRRGVPLTSTDPAVQLQVVQDCQRANGVPLLLVLAARSGLGGAPSAEQRTVDESIRELIEPLDRTTASSASAMAMLPGGIDAILGQAVTRVDPSVVERSLRQLAWLGLAETMLERDAIRYRMVDAVGGAVRTAMSDSERELVLARAAEHLEQLGRLFHPDLGQPRQYAAMGALDNEMINLRYLLTSVDPCPLDLAERVADFLGMRGFGSQGATWLEEHRRSDDPLVAARATVTAARIARFGGNMIPLVADLEVAHQVLHDVGDLGRANAAAQYAILGLLYQGGSRRAAALASSTEQSSTNEWTAANRQLERGYIAVLAGRTEEGLGAIRDARQRLESIDLGAAAVASWTAGLVGGYLGADDALDELARAKGTAEWIGDQPLAALCEMAELNHRRRNGNARRLADRYRSLALSLDRAGLPERAAHARREAGAFLLDTGRREEAAVEFLAAVGPLLRADQASAAVVIAGLSAAIESQLPLLADTLASAARGLPTTFVFPLTEQEQAHARVLLDRAALAEEKDFTMQEITELVESVSANVGDNLPSPDRRTQRFTSARSS